MRKIAIVGGGFSGSLTVVQLMRQSVAPLEITMVEKRPGRVGKGLAYSTVEGCHLLNVPVKGMSALPDQPAHFLQWAQAESAAGRLPGIEVHADAFLPRMQYGRYVEALLQNTIRANEHRHRFRLIAGEVTDVITEGDAATLTLQDGSVITADRVVLALGNFPPSDPLGTQNAGWYHGTPWDEDLPEHVMGSQACAIIGTGLTMLDVVLMLHDRQYAGTLHVISRRGLLPKPHNLAATAARDIALPYGKPLAAMVRHVRELARREELAGGGWRNVLDAMRPHNAELWQALSFRDRRAFVRHVRRYWENHRHRAPSPVYERFQQLVAAGRVQVHQGRVAALTPAADGHWMEIRCQQAVTRIKVSHVVNCTGGECDYRKVPSKLVHRLLERGTTMLDPLGFGIKADRHGALVGLDALPSRVLYTLGPPMKGALWETTAVPEIRMQAANLAKLLSAERPGAGAPSGDSSAAGLPARPDASGALPGPPQRGAGQ